MRIMITGATGYIGSAIAAAAQRAGDEVLGLAHTVAGMQALAARGITPLFGDLTDREALANYARGADAVIHAGFAGGNDGAAVDRAATEALAHGLAGTGRPLIYTSGVWVLGPTGDLPADEGSPVAPIALVAWRGALERWLREPQHAGARHIIIRPGVVYGNGGGIPAKIAAGVLPMVGDGRQRWPVVHVDDLATLYLAALQVTRPGAVLHGVGGVVPAEVVVGAEPVQGRRVSMELEAARGQLGAFAEALALDQVVQADRTRAELAWRPRPAPSVSAGTTLMTA